MQLGQTSEGLHAVGRPGRISILVGRELHCLRHLIDDIAAGFLNAQLVCILSNHADAQPLAAEAGVFFEHHAADNLTLHLDWLSRRLDADKPDLIVLARYMRILPPQLVKRYPDRIINIHPSLAPTFAGPAPYKQAFDAGVRLHGCTAHFVTERLDEGPIIAQDVFQIDVGRDSIDDIQQNAARTEAQTLSRAVQMAVNGQLSVRDGKVIYADSVARPAVA